MDEKKVIKETFRKRQTRQILAMAIAMFLVLLCAVIYKRPVYFGTFTKAELYGTQVVIIALFIGFTGLNWRCPSCKKYLGSDIHRAGCRCGARFQ